MLQVKDYPLVSDQIEYNELAVIIRNLEKVLAADVPGDIVELGCYNGTTSLFIARVLRLQDASRGFHVYDSFQGLPEKAAQDSSPAGEQFKAGELTASKNKFIQHFRQAGLALPVIHKCWFSDLTPVDTPDKIALAFLDGDFYDSIRDSLRVIETKLSPGSVVLVDDYQSEALPGARKAVDEWLRNKPYKIHAEHSLAVIQC